MLLIGLSIVSLIVSYLVFAAQKNNVGDNPNYFLGYRTPTSMKSKEIWNYSQKIFKKAVIKIQFLVLLLGCIWVIYDVINFPSGNSMVLQAIIYFLSVILVIIFTEIQIQKFAREQK